LQASEARLAEAEHLAHLGFFEFAVPAGDAIWSAETYCIVDRDRAQGAPATLEEYLAYVQPDDRARVRHATEAAVCEQKPFNLEYRLRRPDGSERIVQSVGHPVVDAHGRVTRVFGTLLDITERKRCQQQQEELLHIVSHDLRLPLTVIRGHIEVIEATLRKEGLHQLAAESMYAVNRAVQRLNVMIINLVEMARLEGRHVNLRRSAVTLVEYLPDLLQRMTGTLGIARIHLTLAPDLPPVWADYHRLERIVLNLLTNALKYSPPHTHIELCATAQGGEVAMAICDRGCGINPNDLPNIFNRFYRASGRRTADSIGLGLYITKLLVEAHGGRIWAESTRGEGSTFTFTLPVAPSSAPL
jgi:NtrC-family two-component system sensor histidine kinase KinB